MLTKEALAAMKVVDLRNLAKEKGISSVSSYRKNELVEAILKTQRPAQKRTVRKKEKAEEKATSRKPRRASTARVAVEKKEDPVDAEKPAETVTEKPEEAKPAIRKARRVPSPRRESKPSEAPAESKPAESTAPAEAEAKTKNEPESSAVEPIEREDDSRKMVAGVLDLNQDGYGFLRTDHYDSGDDDIYVPAQQIRRFRLRTGDFVEGIARETNDKFNALIFVSKVNEDPLERLRHRPDFDSFIPIYPDERIVLENDPTRLAPRLIDLIAPIGKGQRGLIVSPPKAGKTTLLKEIANAVTANHPDIQIIVLLIDERPEEVTDIRRSVQGDVVASTFDELPQNHIKISEIVLERAKRMVEHGRDVVILLDSITRLTRAYNLVQPPSGKILSGGLDPASFYKPKRFFGAARNIENGGSLTIIATALIDTGSRMDDVIYEEFKGTGNMELHLDRSLANLRIYPAIDIPASGTRRDDLLQHKREMEALVQIRRLMARESDGQMLERMYRTLREHKTNAAFVEEMRNAKNG